MFVYRLTKQSHSADLSGTGSYLFGGRWNHKGSPCIYSSENRALAILEYAVHTIIEEMPEPLALITYHLPDDDVYLHHLRDIPEIWRHQEANFDSKDFGTKLLNDSKHLLIKIPSVIVPREYNFMINPLHKDAKKLTIENITEYTFDKRIKQ